MAKFRCPGCEAKYSVPASAAGRRTKCRQCGQVFRIPAAPPPKEEAERPIELVDFDALATGEVIDTPRERRAAVEQPDRVSAGAQVGYAPGAVPAAAPGGMAGEFAGYFYSLGRSLAFPVRAGDLVTFVIVWVIVSVGDVVVHAAGCLGFVAWLITMGWYMSFQLNVVLSGAAGEDELPTLAFTGGWVDDIIVPFLKLMVTNVIIYLPVVVYLVTSGVMVGLGGGLGGGPLGLPAGLGAHTLVAFGLLVALGYFVWPMFVLIVAVGSIVGLVRLDLIAMTIGKTLPAYLLAVLVVYISVGVRFAAGMADDLLADQSTPGGMQTASLVIGPLANIVGVYTTVIAMRAIGLYYHHFKRRFAWDWG